MSTSPPIPPKGIQLHDHSGFGITSTNDGNQRRLDTTSQLIDLIDHDAVDTGGSLKIGGRARTDLDDLTAVSENNRSDCFTDRRGRLLIDSDRYQIASTTVTTTSDTTIISAPGSGLKLQVYNFNVSICATIISEIGGPQCEGIEFRFGASGSYYHQVVWPIVYLASGGITALPLATSPFFVNLQHGHWDGGDNQAFVSRLLGLSSGGATCYVTIHYRIMPI